MMRRRVVARGNPQAERQWRRITGRLTFVVVLLAALIASAMLLDHVSVSAGPAQLEGVPDLIKRWL